MSKQSIKIARLEIRLQGVTAQTARAAVRDLGHALLGRLAASPSLGSDRRAGKLDQVDAGHVRLASDSAPAALRATIANKVAAAIKAKLNGGSV